MDSSTQNIHIKANIIVTENDGHVVNFEQLVRVNVEPVIETTAVYQNSSIGNEDRRININWHPDSDDYFDADEHFTKITIEDIPLDTQIIVNNSDVSVSVTDSADGMSQVLVIEPNSLSHGDFTQASLVSNFIQMIPPADSSKDFTLTTVVEIEERDHEYTADNIVGEGGRVTATLTGTVNVVVRAIVEDDLDGNSPDNRLAVFNEGGTAEQSTILADDNGVIRFTTNSNNVDTDNDGNEIWDGEYVLRYLETDASSDEVITDLIIELTDINDNPLPDNVISQLVVTGAAYEGDGRWIILDKNAFSVSAPEGLDLTPLDNNDANATNQIKMHMDTLVADEGEDNNERSPEAERFGSITLEFKEFIEAGDEVAAAITITPDSVISVDEDSTFDLGKELDDIIQFNLADDSADEVTIVLNSTVAIDNVDYSISLTGGEVDFINDQYVFQAGISDAGVVDSLSGLFVTLPNDYSGDFRLPFTVITKDTTSGHEQTRNGDVVIEVSPLVDVGANTPNITLDIVESLDADLNTIAQDGSDPLGFEDTFIVLNLAYQLGDRVNGAEGGDERLNSLTLTLDGDVGDFYTNEGIIIGPSIPFTEADIAAGALDRILFKPDENYPDFSNQNRVSMTISGSIMDSAEFNDPITNPTSNGSASDSATFTSSTSFAVTPVVDDVRVTDADGDTLTVLEVTTDEDDAVRLGEASGATISLTDLDGSESFVSLKLTGVPEGFSFTADSGYNIKNNGDGVWSIQLPPNAGANLDLSAISVLPPKNFSGEATFGMTAFTQEALLGVPTEAATLPNFVLTVLPVGDSLDIDATDQISGLEGENIDIDIKASVIDRVNTGMGAGIQSENGAEIIRVRVEDVPEDARIYYPDGVTLADYNSITGVWTLTIEGQELDKIVFNSGQHNSDDDNAKGIDSPLKISVLSVDRDADDNEYLGPAITFDVDLVIDPENDQPTFVDVTDIQAVEDIAIAIDTFTIADIDASFDDPDADYTLTLSVDKVTLQYTDYIGVEFALMIREI
ncbi:hypothetical protein [Vibrio mexicanus]|uniref:hypothetical protein n=1 Tax=Vibrio mexicanus TaxID=1004326 RepID=UPI00069B52D6|nr:hypothetical protein [Vibrio mexicanus]